LNTNITNYIKSSIETKELILSNNLLISKIADASKKIIECYKTGKKVLLAGNGGSAADAQHIAAELVSKFSIERSALNAIALTTNTSILTAISNDYGYENIFSRQIEAYSNIGDVYIAISTSGNSKNIIKSIKTANKIGVLTIGFTGSNPSEMDNLCKISLKVPSNNTPIIQESHIMIGHLIAKIIEENLFQEN